MAEIEATSGPPPSLLFNPAPYRPSARNAALASGTPLQQYRKTVNRVAANMVNRRRLPRTSMESQIAGTYISSPVRPQQPPSPPPQVGVALGDNLFNASSTVINQWLDAVVALGAKWIRHDFSWADIQPTDATHYTWTSQDAIVAAANARSLQVVGILAYTPPWAGQDSSTMFSPPLDNNQFAAFATAAVQRYAPQGVHTWEIWNEPNVPSFWYPTPNAANYCDLLKAAAAAIKAADPTARIISAGLAPAATNPTTQEISPVDFLTTLCTEGGVGVCDVVGFHPYSFPVPPGYNADWNAWNQIVNTTPSLQSVLVSYGYSTHRIWCTEYGAPTNGPGPMGTADNNYGVDLAPGPDHVDDALQAVMATDSVALARSTPIIGALFWYTYPDLGTDWTNTEDWYGVVRYGSRPPATSFSIVQEINGGETNLASATSITLTTAFTSNVSIANRVLVFLCFAAADILSTAVSDSQGSQWARLVSNQGGLNAAPYGPWVDVWTAVPLSNGPMTITVTGATYDPQYQSIGFSMCEVSGLDIGSGINCLDVFAMGDEHDGSITTTSVSTGITNIPIAGAEMAIVVYGDDGGAEVITPPAGYSEDAVLSRTGDFVGQCVAIRTTTASQTEGGDFTYPSGIVANGACVVVLKLYDPHKPSYNTLAAAYAQVH